MAKLQHLTDYLEHHALKCADKPALITDTKTLTWSELNALADSYAYRLAMDLPKHGTAEHQKVIGIMMPNDWQSVVAYLAILKTGHIALPIDPSYKKIEIEAIFTQMHPSIITGHDVADYSHLANRVVNYQQLSESTQALDKAKTLRFNAKQQIASLLFTSGTTGRPKAAPNTHANHIWNIEVCSQVWGWDDKDTLLISLRLSHWYGLVMGLSGALYHGNTLYLQDWFDPLKTLQSLSSGKISIFTHVPFAYQEMVAQNNSEFDLSKVRLCISGGAPLPPSLWHEFKDKFGVEILECYGSSETGRIASNLPSERIPGSPGRILPGVRLHITASGEVSIKSPGVFPGYFHNAQASKHLRADGDWWRTGDIGELVNGRLVLKGRVQEKIRKLGYTISPRDIEWALLKNPRIKEAYVMGRQSESGPNDELIYFIVSELSDQELEAYYKSDLLFAWRPDKVLRLDKLPRTTNNKPRISSLKALAEQ